MYKVHIATSRQAEIGNRCIAYAKDNLPANFELTDIAEECDVFISVLYDTIISEEFIAARRSYNFHPGILPDFRGAGAFSWALINKEKETGITLHEIDANIDNGPIIDVSKTAITAEDTAGSLFVRCMDLLFNLFVTYFNSLLTGNYTTHANAGGCLYLRKDLEVAKDISHIVRAFTFEGKESAYWIDSEGNKKYAEFIS